MMFVCPRAKKIARQLYKLSAKNVIPVSNLYFKEGVFYTPEQADQSSLPWKPFKADDTWGVQCDHAWFRAEVTVPDDFKDIVTLRVLTDQSGWDAINPQMLVFINGKIIQGADIHHTEIIYQLNDSTSRTFTLDIQAYGMMQRKPLKFICDMVNVDYELLGLHYDLDIACRVVEALSEEYTKVKVETIINDTVNKLDLRIPYSDNFYQSVIEARAYIFEHLFSEQAGYSDAVATCIGHTHIDVAWRWTVEQSREKVARSFATVLKLMEEYPDYKFMSSQPQLYKMVKERYPDLYERIREKIKEGRWETEGGMWLEADCNVTSGESLVRQFLHGKKFFKEEFGSDNKILWLPDVFGYSAALPQICRKAGIDYFMTTKISWNQLNKIPMDTFMWQGIDSTEIFTHFVTAKDSRDPKESFFTTYNCMLKPSMIKGAWDRYQQKELNNDVLISFGHGDGGGGPTREMLENAKRLKYGAASLPIVRQEFSKKYFDELYERVKDHPHLPKWMGELYLEYHRGTYTSMARNKKANRKNEILWQDVEFISTFAEMLGSEYPKQEIFDSWENILLNQFHDILPGSSIKEVYDVTKVEYEQLEQKGKEILQNKLQYIADQLYSDSEGIFIFNTLSFDRDEVVTIPYSLIKENSLVDENGEEIVLQKSHEGDYVAEVRNIPAKGGKILKYSDERNNYINRLTINGNTITTPFAIIKFDEQGFITSLFDIKSNREVIKAGCKANILKVFEDKPMDYDNWDIDIYYTEKFWIVDDVTRMEWIEQGPVRATLLIERNFLNVPIIQKIHFYNHTARIDFETTVDWKLSQHLLKAEFPVDINAQFATYDIQFGNVQRPTHRNTSWDTARFEVCAHKWADMSESDFGVSIINDCKYGHDIYDKVMRLTLLKAGTDPNPKSDIEKHMFTYSIYPHKGTSQSSDVVKEAYQLNVPTYVCKKDKSSNTIEHPMSYLSVFGDNVILETVKQAEDGEGTIIRLYEYKNSRSNIKIQFNFDVHEVFETDLIENEIQKLTINNNQIEFEVKPFEIKTFKVK